jgi:cytidyltransferase-like protein
MTKLTVWPPIHYGVVLGRFQPLHLGHIEYLEVAREKVDQLVIGITNPDTAALIHDSADPRRSQSENNPFSYFDRYQMVTASLTELGWSSNDFVVVPAPINTPQEMKPYLPPPLATTVYITVYDAWGDRKADLMREVGYKVSVLWRRERDDRLTSGTDLRRAMRSGEPWRELVPGAVARYLDQSGWTTTLAKGSAHAAEDRPTPTGAAGLNIAGVTASESRGRSDGETGTISPELPGLGTEHTRRFAAKGQERDDEDVTAWVTHKSL